MKKFILLILLCPVFTGKVFSQITATLAGYPLVTTGWNIGGFGTVVDSTVRLTTAGTNENGYVYYNTPVDLTACAQFTIKFDYRIVPSGGAGVADGIAFFYIINPPSGFITGGGLGLPNPLTGMVFTLDTWDNDGDGLNPESEIYGYTTASTYNEGNLTQRIGPVHGPLAFMDDGTWHHCEIDYNAGNILVYYDYNPVPGMTGYYLITIPSGYFGFSASTGAGYSTQSVKNVHIFAVGLATPPTVVSPVNYCQNDVASPLTATGAPGSTIRWFTTDTGTVVALPGAPTPNTSVVGTTTYYVRQGDAPCMSAPDSIKVIVSPHPAAPIVTDPSPYCQGAPFIPFGISGLTGTMYWYPSAAGAGGTTTTPGVSTTVPGTFTYYYGQSVAACASPVDSIKIVVEPAPAAIAGAADVCQYFSITLSDASTGATWSSSNAAVATISSAGVVNGLTAGTATISYQFTSTGCYTTKLITVHPKPAKPLVTPPTYCQLSTSAALTGTPATGLLWYGPGVTAGSGTAPTPVTLTAGVTNYYVTETSVFGCVSDSSIDPVTIIAKPAPPATRDTAYCLYGPTVPVNFDADSVAGSVLNWYTIATGGAPLGYVPLPANTVVTFPMGTVWYVSQTVNGCESNRAAVDVTIMNLPSYTISASKFNVCDHDTVSLAYTSTVPLDSGTYFWQLPGGTTLQGGTTDFGPSVIVKFDSVYGRQVIYLTVEELFHKCTSIDTIELQVIPLPTAHAYMQPDVCLGDTVSLSVSDKSADASLFSWYIDGTVLGSSPEVNIVAANSNSGGPYSLSWNDSGMHIITVMCTTNEGCKSAATYDTVKVHGLPDATFMIAPKAAGTLCLEDSVLFTANHIDYNYSYLWQPEHFFNNNNRPNIWGKVDEAKSEVTLTVTDPYGCKASTMTVITPDACCTVLFPNAFTPNGDTKNDFFRPIFQGYHRFHMFRIVNRWGQTVFESSDSDPRWDGTHNGVPQDLGVYYYYIKYDCGGQTMEQKGDCTLVR